MKTKINWWFLLQTGLMILTISYLLLFASTHNGLVNMTVLAVSATLFTLAGLYWLRFGLPRKSPLDWPLLALFLVLLVTSLTSIDPRRSLSEFWLVCMSLFLFLFTSEIIQKGASRELILTSTLVVGAIIMAFAWFEVYQWYATWRAATGSWLPDINYRLPLPNFFSVILNAFLMFSVAFLVMTRKWLFRLLLGLFIVSDAGLVFLTSSRGGWLGTACGLFCLTVLSVIQFRKRIVAFWQTLRKRWIVVGGGSVTLTVILTALGWLLYKQAMHPTHTQSLVGARSYLWIPAWNAFLRSPLLGEGPFTYISQYVSVHSVPPHEFFVYSHNLYLDTLSGSGLPGLVVFIWFVVILIIELFRNFKNSTGFPKAAAAGALAALAAFFSHGLLDSVHHTIPTSAFAFAILTGAAISPTNAEKKSGISLPSILILGSVIVLSWLNIWRGDPFEKGVTAANQGAVNVAESALQTAVERDPNLAVAWQQLGLVQSQMIQDGDGSRIPSAIHSFERAVTLDPNWALNLANLGVIYRAAGDLERARASFEAAVQKAPQSAIFLLNLGEIAELQGDLSSAAKFYQKVFTLRPDWIPAYFWRENNFRRELSQSWLREHPEPAFPTVLEIEQEISINPDLAAPYLQMALADILENRPEEARRWIEKARLAYFASEEERITLAWVEAEWYAARGDYSNAVKLAESSFDGFRKQGLYGAGSYGKSVYSALMFRRPALAIDLTPQMTIIKITDEWGRRMMKLVSWYEQMGDEEKARARYEELLREIPDFSMISFSDQGY